MPWSSDLPSLRGLFLKKSRCSGPASLLLDALVLLGMRPPAPKENDRVCVYRGDVRQGFGDPCQETKSFRGACCIQGKTINMRCGD